MKKYLFSLILLYTSVTFSQEKLVKDSIADNLVELKGQILSFETKEPLAGAHLLNLNLVIGTTTSLNGNFDILTKANDTIYISYLGHQSIKLKITNDLLKGNELVIELHEKIEEINEVIIKSHTLIGVLEIDAKNVPKDKFTRIHIDGIPQTYEIGAPKTNTYSSPVDALFKPIDFLYNKFGKKPLQLKKLKKLRDEDNLRKMLEARFNREVMMEYLEMDAQSLNDLLDECNYSKYFIKNASDLQIIEAVLECYENYKAIKKGSTKKERILNTDK